MAWEVLCQYCMNVVVHGFLLCFVQLVNTGENLSRSRKILRAMSRR